MKLWIFEAEASHDDIEQGCKAAETLILARGFSVQHAYDAVLARSNRERFDRKAAQAWDDAEDEAFRVTYGGDDDWPDEAVMAPAPATPA
jgi:hypothetical protein